MPADEPQPTRPERRRSYTEEDVLHLTSNPRFLVAVDAYGSNCCNLQQMLGLAFTEPPYLPRNLDALTFAHLVHDVVRRIRQGELVVSDKWKRDYEHFYEKQCIPPID